jgi:hypothetical protein
MYTKIHAFVILPKKKKKPVTGRAAAAQQKSEEKINEYQKIPGLLSAQTTFRKLTPHYCKVTGQVAHFSDTI